MTCGVTSDWPRDHGPVVRAARCRGGVDLATRRGAVTLHELMIIMFGLALLMCVKLAVMLHSVDPIVVWCVTTFVVVARTQDEPWFPAARVLRRR